MGSFKSWLLVAVLAGCAAAPPPSDSPIAQLEAAWAAQPERTPIGYVLATYHDRAGEPEQVVRVLERLERAGWTYGVGEFDFKSDTPAFRTTRERLNAIEPKVSKATVAFTVAGARDLLPEGIAYDPADDVFYLSSLRYTKVLRVDRDGRATDFVTTGQDGIRATLGMHVDPVRRLLWVASGVTPEMPGYTPDQAGFSALHAYSLRDGKLVKKVTTGSNEKPSMLNDVTLLADGSLFVTDTPANRVLRLAADADTFEVFAEDLRYPNGIAVADDEESLYVADFRGINRFSVRDKSRQLLAARQPLAGIDGLAYDHGTLIGIQNAAGNPRVLRIHLAEQNRVELLESKNPLFHLPTTGVVARDGYYFIANSMMRAFEADGTIWPTERLREPVILRITP
jgi:sugar lactone lactonase YvrE